MTTLGLIVMRNMRKVQRQTNSKAKKFKGKKIQRQKNSKATMARQFKGNEDSATS